MSRITIGVPGVQIVQDLTPDESTKVSEHEISSLAQRLMSSRILSARALSTLNV